MTVFEFPDQTGMGLLIVCKYLVRYGDGVSLNCLQVPCQIGAL